MDSEPSTEKIIKTLKNKSVLKQEVFGKTKDVFEQMKESLEKTTADLQKGMKKVKNPVSIKYRTQGAFEAEIKFAGDILIFQMHTNVFNFDKSHSLWKTTYIKEDNMRAYCGMINVYNFLSDSFKFNRINDSGYLVARIFNNKDLHFFVEGKRQLGFLYNDFVKTKLDKKAIKSIIESAILYTLDFDLLTPPYDTMKEVTVQQMAEISESMKIKTGKRLGFKYLADNDPIGKS